MTTTAERVWTPPAGHVVVSAHEQEHRVSSDHAMLDSGSGFAVTTWDGKKEHYHYINTGWGDGPFPKMPAPNASAADLKKIATWKAARTMISEVTKTAGKAHFLNAGVCVEVISGRKAPRGLYIVRKHAMGDWGPYVDIFGGPEGRTYRYIHVDNVRVVPKYRDELAKNPKTFHKLLLPFFVAMCTQGVSAGIAVLADFIEERNLKFTGDHTAAEFAEALRNIAADEPKMSVSTYYADCHNEFRQPFAGI